MTLISFSVICGIEKKLRRHQSKFLTNIKPLTFIDSSITATQMLHTILQQFQHFFSVHLLSASLSFIGTGLWGMTEFSSLASETLNLCWSRYSQSALTIKADCVVCYWLDLGMLWIETSWSIFTFWKWLFPRSLPAAATGTCSEFTYKCKNQVCINKLNAECDRINDCSDNSDEAACGRKRNPHFYTFQSS